METNLDTLAKEKGIVCWMVPTSFDSNTVLWGYEIEVLPFTEIGKYYSKGINTNIFCSKEDWKTYDEAKWEMIKRANEIFDEWWLAVGCSRKDNYL